MTETNPSPLWKGAHNLLINCAGIATGERLAIICEDPSLGWYDSLVPEVVCKMADTLGLSPTMIPVSGPTPDRMLRKMQRRLWQRITRLYFSHDLVIKADLMCSPWHARR